MTKSLSKETGRAYWPIDLTLEDEIVALARISREAPNLRHRISFTQNALATNHYYVTSGIANPRHKEFIHAFNRGLKRIRANGVYSKIIKNYELDGLVGIPPHEFSQQAIWKIIRPRHRLGKAGHRLESPLQVFAHSSQEYFLRYVAR